jgi:hypothetical protein
MSLMTNHILQTDDYTKEPAQRLARLQFLIYRQGGLARILLVYFYESIQPGCPLDFG